MFFGSIDRLSGDIDGRDGEVQEGLGRGDKRHRLRREEDNIGLRGLDGRVLGAGPADEGRVRQIKRGHGQGQGLPRVQRDDRGRDDRFAGGDGGHLQEEREGHRHQRDRGL